MTISIYDFYHLIQTVSYIYYKSDEMFEFIVTELQIKWLVYIVGFFCLGSLPYLRQYLQREWIQMFETMMRDADSPRMSPGHFFSIFDGIDFDQPSDLSSNTDCIYTEITLSQEEDCCICFEASQTFVQMLQCSHRFHKGCIDTWIKQKDTCPICRTKWKLE